MPRSEMHPVLLALVINIATLSLKILGLTDTKSSTLLADTLNDFGDCLGLLFLILGLYLSRRRKSSIDYPFGMSRAAYVFGLISISIMGGILFAISLISSLNVLLSQQKYIESKGMALAFVLPALVLNGVNMTYSVNSYRREGHNDPGALGALIDGITDFIGSVFATVAVALLNSLIDGVGGIVVSLILLVSSTSIGYRYFIVLIGRAPPKGELLRVVDAALSVPEVLDINELKAVMLTENEYLVILEVEIAEGLGVGDLEALSHKIESVIKKSVPKAKHVVIEFAPRKQEPPTYRKIVDEIRRLPK